MSAGTAWAAFVGAAAERLRDEAAHALAQAGLEPRELDGGVARGPGIVFFDDASPDVCELVRRSSRNGLQRVAAVACARSALADRHAWLLLQEGASDVFVWHDAEVCSRALAARFERWRRVDELTRSPAVQEHLVGESLAWRSIVREVVEVARFTDAPVLITGESGTGKELVARLIHSLDSRPRKGELVVLDCTTVVPTLSGSEFFGHERGAFTGAASTRDGAFALADGGTLFLDEVGELPLPLQAELLRVVQEGTYKRVGSNTWRETNFRLVCATNRDLAGEEARECFRRDFYYRIAACTVCLPSLGERRGDILPLVAHFFRQLRPDGDALELDEAVRQFLLRREYHGNVRDLRHLVARISQRHVGPGPITLGDLPPEERPHAPSSDGWPDETFEEGVRRALALGASLKEISAAAAETAVGIALAEEDGNLPRASRKLGVTPRALQLRQAAGRRSSGALRDGEGGRHPNAT